METPLKKNLARHASQDSQDQDLRELRGYAVEIRNPKDLRNTKASPDIPGEDEASMPESRKRH